MRDGRISGRIDDDSAKLKIGKTSLGVSESDGVVNFNFGYGPVNVFVNTHGEIGVEVGRSVNIPIPGGELEVGATVKSQINVKRELVDQFSLLGIPQYNLDVEQLFNQTNSSIKKGNLK